MVRNEYPLSEKENIEENMEEIQPEQENNDHNDNEEVGLDDEECSSNISDSFEEDIYSEFGR